MIAKPFVPLAEVVYKPVELAQDMLGLNEVYAHLLVVYHFGFWLSLGLSFITNPQARRLYNAVSGLLLGFYFHRVNFLFILFQIASVYPLMAYLPRKSSWKPVMLITTVCLAVRNFFIRWHDTPSDYRVICTNIFMRTWMMCSHIIDSAKLDDPEKSKSLLDFERELAESVKELPTFTQWCGFNLFPSQCWIGENVTYKDWLSFMKYEGKVSKMPIGSNILPALKRFIEGNLLFAFGVSILRFASPFDLIAPGFSDTSYVHQGILCCIVMQGTMTRLLTRFAMLDAACIASGISYTPASKEEAENYNTIEHVRVMNCFVISDPSIIAQSWNMRTQFFLKRFVMMRALDRTKPKNRIQAGPIALSFFVSAFFHGWYISYYFTFVGFGSLEFAWKLAETTAFVQMLRKKLPATLISLISTIFLQVLFRFYCLPFFILKWDMLYQIFSPFIWFMWSLTFIAIFASIVAPKARRQKQTASVDDKKEGK